MAPPAATPTESSDNDPRRDPSVRYARAAGINGGIALLLGYAVTTSAVRSERCIMQERRLTIDDGGYPKSSGSSLDCWAYGLYLGSIGVAGGAVAATVLSALSGYRWAERDLRAGVQLSKKRSLGFILGGTGLRLAGLGLMLGGAVLAVSTEECPDVVNGLDSAEVDAHMACYRRRAFGGASIVAAGLSARWVGSGMITYGARHRGHTRRHRQVQVTPYVQPSATTTVAGLTGRF
ncbi:MAG: hypothetical protein AAGF11_45220 [Myxococcota bacterium]